MENELKQIIELLKFLPLDIQVKEDSESIEISIKTNPIKDVVENYQKIIDDLDDCVFIESIEMLKNKVDIAKFEQLLDDPSGQEEDLLKFIEISKECIALCIDNKVKELQELKSRL